MKKKPNPNTHLITHNAMTSLEELLTNASEEVHNPTYIKIPAATIFTIALMSIASGMLYWITSSKEAAFIDKAGNSSAYEPLFGLGGSVTNGLFNAESFFTLSQNFQTTQIQSTFQRHLQSKKTDRRPEWQAR